MRQRSTGSTAFTLRLAALRAAGQLFGCAKASHPPIRKTPQPQTAARGANHRCLPLSLVIAHARAITATEARKSLFRILQKVNDDHIAVEVVSRHGNAVILSKEDYDALTETASLLRNPANAERLLTAIDRARRGEFEQHDLLDA